MKPPSKLISIGRLWWMARVFHHSVRYKNCFHPGMAQLKRYERLRLWHSLFDRDRWMWWKLRLRAWLRTCLKSR